ncbi:MAG: helix-turn-helix domain-containing protein [Bacteroidales bacterium]
MDLRTKRRKLRLTQVELAEQVGVNQPMIAALEAGKYYPTERTQKKVEALIGVVDWIETRLQAGFKTGYTGGEDSDGTEQIMNQLAIYIMRNQVADRAGKFKLLHRYLNKLEKQLKQ